MCYSKTYLLGTAKFRSIFSVLCLISTFLKGHLLHCVCAQMEILPSDFGHQPILPNGCVILGKSSQESESSVSIGHWWM